MSDLLAVLITSVSVVVAFLVVGRTLRVAADPSRLEGWLEERSGRSVLVHLTTGDSVDGVLLIVSPDGLVLRGARYLADSGAPRLAGEVFLPRDKVGFVQVEALPEA